jgi:hypothetical protein
MNGTSLFYTGIAVAALGAVLLVLQLIHMRRSEKNRAEDDAPVVVDTGAPAPTAAPRPDRASETPVFRPASANGYTQRLEPEEEAPALARAVSPPSGAPAAEEDGTELLREDDS